MSNAIKIANREDWQKRFDMLTADIEAKNELHFMDLHKMLSKYDAILNNKSPTTPKNLSDAKSGCEGDKVIQEMLSRLFYEKEKSLPKKENQYKERSTVEDGNVYEELKRLFKAGEFESVFRAFERVTLVEKQSVPDSYLSIATFSLFKMVF